MSCIVIAVFTLKATLWATGDLLPLADVEDHWGLAHGHFTGTIQHTVWKQPLLGLSLSHVLSIPSLTV